MLVGPRSCGKSELLKAVLATQPDELKAVYINGRDGPLDSPGALAKRLLMELDEVASWMEKWEPEAIEALAAALQVAYPTVSAAITTVKGILKNLTERRDADPSEIAPVLDVLRKVCGTVSKPGRYPVFILDEANVLTEWKEAEWQTPLAALLRFFVKVRLCHCDFVHGTRLHSRTRWSLLAQLQRRAGAC